MCLWFCPNDKRKSDSIVSAKPSCTCDSHIPAFSRAISSDFLLRRAIGSLCLYHVSMLRSDLSFYGPARVYFVMLCSHSRDSSVGVMTVSGVRFQAGTRFSSSPWRPDWLWAPPSPLYSGYQGVNQQGRKVDCSSPVPHIP